MRKMTIAQLADIVGGHVDGDGSAEVTGLSEPQTAGPDDLAVAMSAKFLAQLGEGAARAAIVATDATAAALGLQAIIRVERPRLAMAELTGAFAMGESRASVASNIHPSAIVEDGATIEDGCILGANVVVEAGAHISGGTRIGAGSVIGQKVTIGPDSTIAANVTIGQGARIGARFVAHGGVVIGGDGFSFVTPEPSAVDEVKANLSDPGKAASQSWVKIASLGGVVIEDDVEIGANSSVDAGTIRPTHVGSGTKIDALVQVGHNAVIGANCLLCAHVAVGGSAEVGEGSVLGGQVGVADNITLGPGVVAGGATKILSSVPAGRAILGYPAVKMEQHVEIYKALRRLPRLMARVAGLEKAVSKEDAND